MKKLFTCLALFSLFFTGSSFARECLSGGTSASCTFTFNVVSAPNVNIKPIEIKALKILPVSGTDFSGKATGKVSFNLTGLNIAKFGAYVGKAQVLIGYQNKIGPQDTASCLLTIQITNFGLQPLLTSANCQGDLSITGGLGELYPSCKGSPTLSCFNLNFTFEPGY